MEIHHMNKLSSKAIDIMDLMKPAGGQNGRIITKNAVHIHEFYLSGDIDSPEEYIEWFDIIRSASANDIIKIYINSSGGDLFTAIQFMRVLQETDATISVSVEGACMSAATLIFLCGHQFEVSPHSMFMFHNYSSGVMGKGGEMYDRLSHEKGWSEKLMRDVYADFLTDDEISSILGSKDIWMDGDEIIERLKHKVSVMEAAIDKAEAKTEAKTDEPEEDTKPKKRAPRKSKK
jgi:ATP-dependent protease ClpP protease subunit